MYLRIHLFINELCTMRLSIFKKFLFKYKNFKIGQELFGEYQHVVECKFESFEVDLFYSLKLNEAMFN